MKTRIGARLVDRRRVHEELNINVFTPAPFHAPVICVIGGSASFIPLLS